MVTSPETQQDASSVLEDYMTSCFGRTLGTSLLDLSQKKAGVQLAKLTPTEQLAFIKKMLESLYNGFYTHKKIRMIYMNLFFRYCKASLETSMERTLKCPVKIKDITLEGGILEDAADLEPIMKQKFLLSGTTQGLAAGGFFATYDDRSALLITKSYLEAQGSIAENDVGSIDKIEQFAKSACAEFSKAIQELSQKPITIEFASPDQVLAGYGKTGPDYIIETIKTTMTTVIDSKDITLDVTYLFKNDDEESKELARKLSQKLKDDIFNQYPPRVIAQRTQDIPADCHTFLTFVFDQKAKDIVASVTKKLNISLQEKLTPSDINGFINLLVGHYLENATDKKKKFVRKNLEVIFGLSEPKETE